MFGCINLLANFFGYFWRTMTCIEDRDTSIEIEIVFSLMVKQIVTFPPDYLHRFLIKMVNTGDHEIILFRIISCGPKYDFLFFMPYSCRWNTNLFDSKSGQYHNSSHSLTLLKMISHRARSLHSENSLYV